MFTDHRPILGSFASPNLQLHDTVALNAINEIAQHTSDIRYRPGKELLVPDMLSRPFGGSEPSPSSCYVQPRDTHAAIAAVVLDSIKPDNLAVSQKSCQWVQDHLDGLMPRNVKVATVPVNGVNVVCEVSDPAKPRPLVPERNRSPIIQLMHHLDHPGVKETTRRVANDYYWPSLRKEVTKFVQSCHPCQLAKQSRTVDPGVGKIEVPDERFTFIHLDVVGPLPESEGKKYLLSVLDRTSKWLECFPMANATSEECCKAFLEWTSRYGIPSVVMSDNGNTFVANLYQDIMKTFGIKVIFSPAYHQQANGAVERQHQNLKNSLRAGIIDMGVAHKDRWMRALPWTLLGMRNAFRPSLDASSAQLVFGKSLQIPGAILAKPGPPLTTEETKSLLAELYKLADRPAAPMAGKHEEKDISHTENVEQVYYKNHGDEKSLSEKFKGPVPIVSRPSRSTVQLQVGSYRNGDPRLQEFSWSSCKPAHYRDAPFYAFRDMLGRKPTASAPSAPPGSSEWSSMAPSPNVAQPTSNTSPPEVSPPETPEPPDPPPSAPSVVPEPPASQVPTTSAGRPIRSSRNRIPLRYRD